MAKNVTIQSSSGISLEAVVEASAIHAQFLWEKEYVQSFYADQPQSTALLLLTKMVRVDPQLTINKA